MNLAAAIFTLTYILIALGENSPRKMDRPTSTLLGAVLMIVSGSLSRRAALEAIDFHTLILLFGLLVQIVILSQSGLPTWLAARLLRRCRQPQALLFWVVLSGGLSATPGACLRFFLYVYRGRRVKIDKELICFDSKS